MPRAEAGGANDLSANVLDPIRRLSSSGRAEALVETVEYQGDCLEQTDQLVTTRPNRIPLVCLAKFCALTEY